MEKKHLSLLSLACLGMLLFSAATQAQEQAGQLEADLSQDVRWLDAPPINLGISVGHQSNMDLLDSDKNIYGEAPYQNNTVMEISGSTAFENQIGGSTLTYTPSLNATLIEDSEYVKSNDAIRKLKLNNSLFLKLAGSTDALSFGPTLDLNAEKRFTFPGYHRKRDNINGLLGAKVSAQPSDKLVVDASIGAGYLDHSGNYVDLKGSRVNEFKLQEDRSIYKASLSAAYAASKNLTISLPLSYKLENFTEKRARTSQNCFHTTACDKDLAFWTAANGQPTMDEALILVDQSVGLDVASSMGPINVSANYTFVNTDETNAGQNRNDANTNNYALGVNANLEEINVGISYAQEDIHYNRILGGGTREITHTYAAKVVVPKIINDIDGMVSVQQTEYRGMYPGLPYASAAKTVSADEDASDILAMVGISTTL